MSIGAGIKQLRDERGWSQEKLAREAQMSRGAIDNTEKAKTDPKFKTIEILATAFGMNVWDFIRECLQRGGNDKITVMSPLAA
jgi:transcriptional regulator with XRE-family HTH domain